MVDIDLQEPEVVEESSGHKVKADDYDLVEELAFDWRNKVAYFHSDWHVYDNGCWQIRHDQEVKWNIVQFLRRFRYGTDTYAPVPVNSGRVNSLLSMAEMAVFIPDRKLIDRDTNYINLRNGIFNLTTMQLEPHNPDLYFTNQLDFEYNPDADCPTFRRFLRTSLVTPDGEPDHQLITLLKQALAYSMTADTSMKASFWLVGKPDSGKSTLIAFMRKFMGDMHSTIDLNQLATNRFLLSGIVGKRVVTFTEASANSVLPDALYKAMVGGEDEIYVDVKNKPGISFVPRAKFWWAMNGLPRVLDRSGAVFNRLHMIPFNRTIPPSERISGLADLLADEKPGIFNELLLALARLRNGGKFELSDQSQKMRDEYRLENDTEGTFIDEQCQVGDSFMVQSSLLYDTYREWCESNGFHPKNANQLAKEWERLGFTKVRKNDGRFWSGLKLNPVSTNEMW